MPGVADLTEHHVVALPGQEHATSRELQPEPAADQHHQSGALLACHPLRAPVAGGMDGPLDLNLLTMPSIIDWPEMPKKPSTVNASLRSGTARIDRLRHEQEASRARFQPGRAPGDPGLGARIPVRLRLTAVPED